MIGIRLARPPTRTTAPAMGIAMGIAIHPPATRYHPMRRIKPRFRAPTREPSPTPSPPASNALVVSLQNLAGTVEDLADSCRHLSALAAIGTRLTPAVSALDLAELGNRFVGGIAASFSVHMAAAVRDVTELVAERPNAPEAAENLAELRRCINQANAVQRAYYAALLTIPGLPEPVAVVFRGNLAAIDALPAA